MTQTHGRLKKRKETKKQKAVQLHVSQANGETIANTNFSPEQIPQTTGGQPVIVKLEDRRKYLLEALLIIFSVLLALSLNELRAYWQEKRQTKQLLYNIKEEIIKNKGIIEYQHRYYQQVLKNIDSALTHAAYKDQIFAGDDFNVLLLAPEGIITGGFIDETAWNVAKSNNILTKVDFATVSQLTYIYDQQQMVLAGFEHLRTLYTERAAQKRANADETLKLMRKIYSGYITARAPDIIISQKKMLQQME